ncbi:hypothetical protein QJS10_CPB11g02004 [Acorus calamus]|uniref:Polygalacturonase n=1 Tax=Acorus calamus TaxID=4465 RepID=A0AAV9DUA9_ACOCL|nr:hypothetical protein QJS10_CPB11g02004 [Acorus calamus]
MLGLDSGPFGRAWACPTAKSHFADFGAKGDGSTDDTQAFSKAWSEACSSSSPVSLMIPHNNKYLVKPVTFSGPCKSNVTALISGTIIAPAEISIWGSERDHWIHFKGVQNLTLDGDGTFEGNGNIWWSNSCKLNKSLALKFEECNSLTVKNINMINSPQMHIVFLNCDSVNASHLFISAPENSPNTDGVHVTGTTNIKISNSTIQTGDDCISIVSGSENVWAGNITCGPGHGISIGSLGEGNSEDKVLNVIVENITFTETMNGVRIKTWQTSAVEVSEVLYNNIRGTSATDVVMSFDCSASVLCRAVVLEDIHMEYHNNKGKARTVFNNIQWSQKGEFYVGPGSGDYVPCCGRGST